MKKELIIYRWFHEDDEETTLYVGRTSTGELDRRLDSDIRNSQSTPFRRFLATKDENYLQGLRYSILHTSTDKCDGKRLLRDYMVMYKPLYVKRRLMNFPCIYGFTHPDHGVVYIGRTLRLNDALRHVRNTIRNPDKFKGQLHRKLIAKGICDKLQPVVFEVCYGMSKEEMIVIKKKYIDLHKPMF